MQLFSAPGKSTRTHPKDSPSTWNCKNFPRLTSPKKPPKMPRWKSTTKPLPTANNSKNLSANKLKLRTKSLSKSSIFSNNNFLPSTWKQKTPRGAAAAPPTKKKMLAARVDNDTPLARPLPEVAPLDNPAPTKAKKQALPPKIPPPRIKPPRKRTKARNRERRTRNQPTGILRSPLDPEKDRNNLRFPCRSR
jgi:hypothetical protein